MDTEIKFQAIRPLFYNCIQITYNNTIIFDCHPNHLIDHTSYYNDALVWKWECYVVDKTHTVVEVHGQVVSRHYANKKRDS